MSWFSELFGGDSGSDDGWESSEGWDYDFKDKPDAYNEFLTDYEDDYQLDNDWSKYEGYVPDSQKDKDWYDSFLSPSVIGAAITSGAGLLKGMSDMDIAKEKMKSDREQQRINDLIKLAQLKHQLIGKGAAGGGRRSGGGGANPAQSINTQASAALAGGYQSLGNNLASIYRG